MAHYALLDENNIVVNVIVGIDENLVQLDLDGTEVGGSSEAWEAFYSQQSGFNCKRTSYNSFGGKRKNPETNELTEESGYRFNYAITGSVYDSEKDGFIPPKPSNNTWWQLNQETLLWDDTRPASPEQDPENLKIYIWNEETNSWDEQV